MKNGIVAVNDKVIVRSTDIKHELSLKIPKGKCLLWVIIIKDLMIQETWAV